VLCGGHRELRVSLLGKYAHDGAGHSSRSASLCGCLSGGSAAASGGEPIVAYADVSLLALLLENPVAARVFIDEELGELARPGM
jgi:hypothetical protein